MISKLILAVAFAAAGLAAGWALHPSSAPPAPVVCEAPRAAAPAFDRAELAMLMRAIVREELQRSAPQPPAGAKVEPAHEAPPEPSAEQLTARDDGTALVAGARGSGHWTEEDRRRFRQVMAKIDVQGREELLGTLIPAMNRQEIKSDVNGSPF